MAISGGHPDGKSAGICDELVTALTAAEPEDLAVVGDLVVAPVPFFDTGCEEGWRAALADIAEAEWTTLIPGHGDPMSRADFARWRGAFESWLGCAASDRAASECAERWMNDAEGFYTAEEAAGVRMLAEAYVSQVLRVPASERMGYCLTGGRAQAAP